MRVTDLLALLLVLLFCTPGGWLALYFVAMVLLLGGGH